MMHKLLSRPWCLALLCLLLLTPAARAATPEEVEEAIKKAKSFIWAKYNEQKGNWGDADTGPVGSKSNKSHGGYTAIAVHALLSAGEDPRDPRLKRAVDYLVRTNIDATYAVSLRAQVWHKLPKDNAYRDAATRDKDLLLLALKRGKLAGLYRYSIIKPDEYDHSVSQFGLLGMWGVAQMPHIEVPNLYWETVDKKWRDHQNSDGGWGYRDKKGSTLTMTAAGIATLFITQDYINMGRDPGCNGNLYDEALERGLQWMTRYYLAKGGIGDEVENDNNDNDQPKEKEEAKRSLYALYGISRIGLASGYKYFGKTDWYQAGANDLVRGQAASGAWGQLPDTCFGLLFLSRGRAPVAMNKLNYGIDLRGDKKVMANWNERSRDVNNVVKWMGKQLERDLNWQIVNLQVKPEDLLDSQILYISGNQALSFTDEEIVKLRRFAQLGGLILGHADCGNSKFADSFKRLGTKLFPNQEFRALPQDHVIYTRQQFPAKRWKTKPLVLGLSNGARELMLLIPQADPAKFWQTRTEGGREQMWELASNIFGYTVDRADLRFKGETYLVNADPKAQRGAALKVARLEYAGDWDPEPAGWQRLKNVMGNQGQGDLTIEPVKLGAGKLNKEYAVAHMTGAAAFTLNDAAKKELVDFVKGGGTLIFDALGGAPAFAASAEKDLTAMFPDAALAAIAEDHAIYKQAKLDELLKPRPGFAGATNLYRSAAAPILGGGLRTPRLRGIMEGNRIAVFISGEDLSAGLVGQQVDGIVGYRPDVATNLMGSILSYAAAAPAPMPAGVAQPASEPEPAAASPSEAQPGEGSPAAASPSEAKPAADKRKPPLKLPGTPVDDGAASRPLRLPGTPVREGGM